MFAVIENRALGRAMQSKPRNDDGSKARPACPKCKMRMIAASPRQEGARAFECLRCGHIETIE
jgi:hypothetical protein